MMHAPIARGSGKGGRTPKEAPDSLFSNSIARIVDLLSEGEIEGLVNGEKSVFYNEIGFKSAAGGYNFSGIVLHVNNGKADQPAIPGFDDVRSTNPVSQDLPANTYKAISFPNDGSITSASITIATSNFFTVEADGDTVGAAVNFVIELSQNSGTFAPVYSGTVRGKQRDEYNADYRIPITDPTGITGIRVKRTTPDSTSLKVSDNLNFKSYTKIVEHKLLYPNVAVVAHTIDAKQFGNQIPTRQYHVRGIKCPVPHNYTASTRVYSGPFNGSLKTTKTYTNNPAWLFYELVTNKRFGLGQFIDPSLIDVPSLYQVGKWCDDLVSDGAGGLEPRWVCNTVLTDRGDAFNVLRDLVSCFRGMLFWMDCKLWAMADLPRDPVKIVTNANVIDGMFTYSGESNRSRFSVVNVKFNDPAFFYRQSVETYEDPDLLREFGWRPTDVGGFGCTSRGQARRLAKSILYAQEFESELISYKASFDHLAVDGDGPTGVAPGDVILIADQERGNAIAGGRVLTAAGSAITLDRSVNQSGTGTLYVEHGDGNVEWIACTYNGQVVTLKAAPVSAVKANDLFILVAGGYEAEPFRVIKIVESEPHVYEISAIRYDEGKFAAIYGESSFIAPDIMVPPTGEFVMPPVGPLTFTERYITSVDVYMRALDISWTASDDVLLDYYRVSYSKNDDNWVALPPSSATTVKLENLRPGTYRFRVAATNRLGRESAAIEGTYGVDIVPANDVLNPGTISGLILQSGGNVFGGKDAKFTWSVTTPMGVYLAATGAVQPTTGIIDPNFRDCVVKVLRPNGDVLRTESVLGNTYTYGYEKNFEDTGGVPVRQFTLSVQYRDQFGRTSAPLLWPVSNPAPVMQQAPVVTTQIGGIRVRVQAPVDLDYAGFKVYMSTTSNFTPGPANLVYTGTDDAPVMPFLTTGVPHYVRVAPFDVFGDGAMSVQYSAAGGKTAAELLASLDTNADTIAKTYLSFEAYKETINALVYVAGQPVGAVYEAAIQKLTTDVGGLVSSMSLLGAKSQDGNAFLLNVDGVKVEGDTALSTKLTQLGSENDLSTAKIDSLYTTMVSPTGGAMAKAVMNIRADGAIAGYSFTADGTGGQIVFVADVFKIIAPGGGSPFTPFSIVDGTVYMNDVVANRITYGSLVPLFGGVNNRLDPSSGFQVLPGGMIMQWGRYRGSINSEVVFSVVFPMVFPNGVMAVGAMPYIGSFSDNRDLWLQNVGSPSVQGATFATQAASRNDQRLDGFDWWAWGY